MFVKLSKEQPSQLFTRSILYSCLNASPLRQFRKVTDIAIPHNSLEKLINNFFISGNYSCLAAKFQLHRSIGFHLVQSYVPTILIVIVSWVSFWMDVEHVPVSLDTLCFGLQKELYECQCLFY